MVPDPPPLQLACPSHGKVWHDVDSNLRAAMRAQGWYSRVAPCTVCERTHEPPARYHNTWSRRDGGLRLRRSPCTIPHRHRSHASREHYTLPGTLPPRRARYCCGKLTCHLRGGTPRRCSRACRRTTFCIVRGTSDPRCFASLGLPCNACASQVVGARVQNEKARTTACPPLQARRYRQPAGKDCRDTTGSTVLQLELALALAPLAMHIARPLTQHLCRRCPHNSSRSLCT